MGKRSRSSLGSTPITCWSVMHWALTPRGMPCPQGKKTTGTFRPLEHGSRHYTYVCPCVFHNYLAFSPLEGREQGRILGSPLHVDPRFRSSPRYDPWGILRWIGQPHPP